MANQSRLIKGTRCRLTEKGYKEWFEDYGNLNTKTKNQLLKETVFIAIGKQTGKNEWFKVIYPENSLMSNKNWGCSMYLRKGEFDPIIPKEIEEWM